MLMYWGLGLGCRPYREGFLQFGGLFGLLLEGMIISKTVYYSGNPDPKPWTS